jgi:glycosyltransferase involved in cell wall biosynthesis
MKLLFVNDNLGEFGGAEAYVELVGRELRKRGHAISLLYQQNTGRNDDAWLRFLEHCFCLPAAPNSEWIEAVLDRVQPDLIFLHNFSHLTALELLFGSGLPAVKMVHDHALYCLRTYKYNYFTREVCHRPLSNFCAFPCLATVARDRESRLGLKWASLSEKRSELQLHQKCAAILTYSEYQKAELISNGFDPATIFLSSPMRTHGAEGLTSSFSDRNLILFAGQIIRGKGVDVLLRALAKVGANFECVILGQGNHRPYCERLCCRLGLGQRVKFMGYVLPAELREFYLQASVFVMSSLWPEPFGMAGPEAMHYGLPVIAFDAGGIKEWLHDGQNGFLVPWGDTQAFARRLDQLLTDKALAKSLGDQARESVRRLEGGGQIDCIEAVLRRVCRAPTGAVGDTDTTKNRVCL